MSFYPFDTQLVSEKDLLNYFLTAIEYRNDHQEDSTEIAKHVFDSTHPKVRLTFPISESSDRLRNEFGALEAPGAPEDDSQNYKEYEDSLWLRLKQLIIEAKK